MRDERYPAPPRRAGRAALKPSIFSICMQRWAVAMRPPDHHCDIVETGNDSWRFKSRDDDHTTRAHAVSATPASSDGGCRDR
jgi:hypothetical protein